MFDSLLNVPLGRFLAIFGIKGSQEGLVFEARESREHS